MRPRAVGGFEPDEQGQAILVELWHLSRTALAGTGLNSKDDRREWAINAFMKEHGDKPNVARKWIYVWVTDNIGRFTVGESVVQKRKRCR